MGLNGFIPNFHPNWTGLAVLFSRQLLNGSQDFFFHIFRIFFFLKDFIKNPQNRNARAFLPLNISAVAVCVASNCKITEPLTFLTSVPLSCASVSRNLSSCVKNIQATMSLTIMRASPPPYKLWEWSMNILVLTSRETLFFLLQGII